MSPTLEASLIFFAVAIPLVIGAYYIFWRLSHTSVTVKSALAGDGSSALVGDSETYVSDDGRRLTIERPHSMRVKKVNP